MYILLLNFLIALRWNDSKNTFFTLLHFWYSQLHGVQNKRSKGWLYHHLFALLLRSKRESFLWSSTRDRPSSRNKYLIIIIFELRIQNILTRKILDHIIFAFKFLQLGNLSSYVIVYKSKKFVALKLNSLDLKVLQFRYLQQISCLARSNQPENIEKEDKYV